MSKFIPQSSLLREMFMHQKRLQHGLKVGTHVRYPDAERGPYIITKKLSERIAVSERSKELAKEVD